MSAKCYYDGISLQNGRRTNMDSVLLKSRIIQSENFCLAAVCDGVGSLADGAYAASSTVKMLSNWFENLEDSEDLGSRLQEYVRTINQAIIINARTRGIETACTLSCLLLRDSHFCVVHIGDSRIYTLEDGALRQLTVDHSRNGRLTASIGHLMDTEVFYKEGFSDPGQRFLLCSDGLYKRMSLQILAEAMRNSHRQNLQKTLHQLTDYVIRCGERDNISAALLVVEEK